MDQKRKKRQMKNKIAEVAELLKSAVLDEQASIIRKLKKENEALRHDNVHWQELYYATEDRLKGEKLQRNFFEQSLKSAENALIYKDGIIDKNNERLAVNKDVMRSLREELGHQYKKRMKAEKILGLVAESLKDFSEKVKEYE